MRLSALKLVTRPGDALALGLLRSVGQPDARRCPLQPHLSALGRRERPPISGPG